MLASFVLMLGQVPIKAEPLTLQEKDRLTQSVTLKGIVMSETDNLPIPGVSVLVKGTTNGTVTDIDGNFSLLVNAPSPILVFSYIGYTSQEVNAANQEVFNITLSENVSELEEMVVMGYRSQKGATISGAISPVDITALESRRVPIITQALQGQVAGVQVTQSTGAPGDEIEIRIRGNGTIGNNNPLYIIDGIPSREISFLIPADIKSM